MLLEPQTVLPHPAAADPFPEVGAPPTRRLAVREPRRPPGSEGTLLMDNSFFFMFDRRLHSDLRVCVIVSRPCIFFPVWRFFRRYAGQSFFFFFDSPTTGFTPIPAPVNRNGCAGTRSSEAVQMSTEVTGPQRSGFYFILFYRIIVPCKCYRAPSPPQTISDL